jgi:M6 family metalloprotease-like protein
MTFARRLASSVAVLLLLAAAAPVRAQDVEQLGRSLRGARPPAGYYETIARNPTFFQFSPENGWIRRGLAIAARRRVLRALAAAAPRTEIARAGFGPGGVLGGVLHVPLLPVLYANSDSAGVTMAAPRTALVLRLYGTGAAPPYSVHNYYRELSGDRLIVNGTVLDWARVAQNDTHYEGGCNGLCAAGDVAGLIREIVRLHDPQLDFGQFDNDGPDGIPNSGDDDGYADALVLLHPEVDGACGNVNPAARSNIWAHRSSYSNWTGVPLATDDPAAAGGAILVRDYIIQGGQGGDDGCTAGQPQAMGVVAHETGHLFGLPDLYNTNSARSSEGIGHWGLMGAGNWRRPFSPASLEAWSRAELGWITEVFVGRDTMLVIEPVQRSDTAFVLPIPGTDEYFLLENRQLIGPDAELHGPGLLVWHIDSVLARTRGLSAGRNQVNAFDPEAVSLEQADGRFDLQLGLGRGDAGDPFPGSGSRNAFGHNTAPSSARNDGVATYVIVDSIAQLAPQGAIRARVRFAGPSLIAANDTLAAFRLNGVRHHRFADVLENGAEYALEMDAAQTTDDGRSRFTWVSWSNGGARSQTFTASQRGDTILATVDTEHLLRVTVRGTGGALASTPPLDLAGGAFLPVGQSVTLVATVTAPGTIFDGWSGGRTSPDDTLTLTMDRPYELTATFAGVLTVAAPELPAATMGAEYRQALAAAGGDGTFQWRVTTGALPEGLSLLSSGVLMGRPAALGTFAFEVEVRSGSQSARVSATLEVEAPALVADDVVSHLVGAAPRLTPDEVSFLDLLGNRNGRLDVGDVLAWIEQPDVSASLDQIRRGFAAREAGQEGQGRHADAFGEGRPR